MPKKTFDDLTIEEKFKAVREDIVTVGNHSNQNQRDIAFMTQSLAELRKEIERLKAIVAELSQKAR